MLWRKELINNDYSPDKQNEKMIRYNRELVQIIDSCHYMILHALNNEMPDFSEMDVDWSDINAAVANTQRYLGELVQDVATQGMIRFEQEAVTGSIQKLFPAAQVLWAPYARTLAVWRVR